MTPAERQQFWEEVEGGQNPLLSVMHGLVKSGSACHHHVLR